MEGTGQNWTSELLKGRFSPHFHRSLLYVHSQHYAQHSACNYTFNHARQYGRHCRFPESAFDGLEVYDCRCYDPCGRSGFAIGVRLIVITKMLFYERRTFSAVRLIR